MSWGRWLWWYVFDNAQITHALGSLALVIILFDGGLQTPMTSIKQMWKPASVMATLGVLLTSTMTVVFVHRQIGDTANKKYLMRSKVLTRCT